MPKPYQVQDKYFQLAKEDGYRARSAYKLKDIQRKFKLIKKGDRVLDLGAAPGSFMQVIRELVGDSGSVVGVDLQAMQPFADENMHCFQGDIFEKEEMMKALEPLGIEAFDVITSDLAPKTTGIKDLDQAASAELTDQAAYLASQLLKKNGHFVGKFFEGSDTQWMLRRIKKKFKNVRVFKPPSCRDRSVERYVIGLGRI